MKSTFLIAFFCISLVIAQSDPTAQPADDGLQTVDPKKPINAIAPIPQCKINEKYTICGTACEPSCDIPNPPPCPGPCVRACQCLPGYYRNKEELCVRLADCPKKDRCDTIKCKVGYTCRVVLGKAQCLPGAPQCKPNESYLQCGTACEPSCDKPVPDACTRQCVAGCQCDSGYYRNKNGDCVKLPDCNLPICTPKCVPRETCALVIPISCQKSPCSAQPMCVSSNPCTRPNCAAGKQCILRQVVCVRAPCDPIAECVPYDCPQNEEYIPCKNACSEKRCPLISLPIAPCPPVCSGSGGCICKSGYYRNNSGKCVTLIGCFLPIG